jgi:hypothetical protein
LKENTKDVPRPHEGVQTINIWQKFKQLPDGDQKNPELIKAMRF